MFLTGIDAPLRLSPHITRLEHSSTSFSGESLGMTIEWITDISIGVSRIRKEMEKDAGLQEQMRGMTEELDKKIIK